MPTLNGKSQKVVIILSTGRTGTQALAQHFNDCYQEVKALHEPPPSWRLRLASNRYLCKRLSDDRMVRILSDSRRSLIARIDQPIYIESNWFLYGFLSAFREVFDSPHIVHVVRDPRTYVPSYINFGTFRGMRWLASNYYPFWYVKPEQYDNNTDTRWRQMSEAQRLAWHWRIVNSELNRGENLYGDHYIRLRYEDVFSNDASGLKRLAQWIGLPPTVALLQRVRGEKVNASQASGFPKWPELDATIKADVLRHCQALMNMYGYREDGMR